MVKHVILWKLKEEYVGDEKEKIMQGIKTGLEGLAGKIPGMTGIHVQVTKLESSNADVMLETYFVDAASLAGYAVHPDHVAAANAYVRPYTQVRLAFDYETDAEAAGEMTPKNTGKILPLKAKPQKTGKESSRTKTGEIEVPLMAACYCKAAPAAKKVKTPAKPNKKKEDKEK